MPTTVTREDIIKRLGMLGYTATEADYDRIDFELQSVVNYTLNYCNISEIPEIVNPKLIDRVCSFVLYYKKNSGEMTGLNFNFDTVIKSIKEGDTQIQYAVDGSSDTPESRFDAFVRKLEQTYDKWITPYRRLRW